MPAHRSALPHIHRHRAPRALPLCLALAAAWLAASAPAAQATTRTWVGGAASPNWLNAPRTSNWSGGDPVSGDKLVFAGTQRLVNTNNAFGLSLAGISFAADAGAFVLSGNPFTSTGDIGNLSGQVQTLNMVIRLANTQFWTGGDAGLVFNGPITLGANGLHLLQNVTLDQTGGDSPLVGSAGNNFSSLLDVAGGSRVLNQNGSIGTVAGTSGWVTVRDAGSQWVNAQTLQVGTAGAGRLGISGGGVVTSSVTYLGGEDPLVGGTATVSVSGAGSKLATEVLTFRDGAITVDSGGLLQTGQRTPGGATTLGGRDKAVTVTVTGAGSAWTEVNPVGVLGSAVVNVNNGGLWSARSVLAYYGGQVNLNGGAIVTEADGARYGGGVFNWVSGSVSVTGPGGMALGSGLLNANTTLSAGKTLNVTGTLTVGADTALQLTGGQLSVGSLTLNGNGQVVYVASTPLRLDSNINGAGTVTVNSSEAVLTFTGARSGGGNTSIGSRAVLSVGDGGTTGSWGGTVYNDGTLVFNRADNSVFDGVLIRAGTLVIQGGGTLVMTAISTTTGATRVNSGGIRMDGSATASAFTVAAGAQVGGTGALGSLMLAGLLSPGDGAASEPARLKAAASTFAAGSGYQWEVADAGGAAGVGYDTLAVNGSLTLAATAAQPFTVHLVSLQADFNAGTASGFDPLQNHHYTLVSASGAIAGFNSAAFSVDPSGFANAAGGAWSVSVSASGHDLLLDYTAAAVPEPQSLALVLAGLLVVGARARRAKSSQQQG
jgi:T5SS/PEP-CTERM-associated repeat protein/autotransporter-associated beta strand protein